MLRYFIFIIPCTLIINCNGMLQTKDAKKAKVDPEARAERAREIVAEVRIVLCDEEVAKIPSFGDFVCPGFPLTLRNLTILSLEGSNLTAFPPGFGELKALRKLSLQHNKLAGLFPDDCSPFPVLEELDISDTQAGTKEVIWSGLYRLKKLVARRAQFRELDDTIANLHSLTSVDFSHNKLSTINSMIYLHGIVVFNFSQNRIGSLSAEISNFRGLEELYLDGNRLQEIPKHVGSFEKLLVLSLSDNKLQTMPEECAQLLALRVLNLARNRLTEKPAFISKLPELQEVYLDTQE